MGAVNEGREARQERVGGLSHCTEVLAQCPRKGCTCLMGYMGTHTYTHTENDGSMDCIVVTHCSCKKMRGTDCCNLTEHVSFRLRDIRGRILSLFMY